MQSADVKIFNQALIIVMLAGFGSTHAHAAIARYVIHISVDGLRADAITTLGETQLPSFFRLRDEGAFTDNARTDANYTVTLPNHTTQITGRPVDGTNGHNYTRNRMPGSSTSLHRMKGGYVSSVFDVIHDHGLSTAVFASKPKFVLYEQSYDTANGAVDLTGSDDGRNKIDVFEINVDTRDLVDEFLSAMAPNPINYTFMHFRDPDTAGHTSQWDLSFASGYLNSVIEVDHLIGKILDAIQSSTSLRDQTVVIVTADHGGRIGTTTHQPAHSRGNHTIPFYVWGGDTTAGVDLYALNPNTRADPGSSHPTYDHDPQPIRNGDAANLSLELLGLTANPGSTINARQDLNIIQIEAAAYQNSQHLAE
ncbi:MAG: putative AlkP superfamily pyrophosphatase or phosphodiesterase [Gammaproteobacteria bacterium]|jgi:predicted AlkP superfamily pyrophosphatase or phosphodiesterase